jgi:L-ribulose-5-phosphate 3-epimerase
LTPPPAKLAETAMNRRSFLTSTLAAPAVLAAAPTRRIDWSRLSLLTDEIARSAQEAIDFAHQYKIQWVELRGIPGGKGSYWEMEPEDLRSAVRTFKDANLRVSFLNTSMLKYDLPGTQPELRGNPSPEAIERRRKNGELRFANRMNELRKSIRAAHAFEVDKIRVFTFTRTADPESLFPRIADILGEMAKLAESEGVQLLVENEGSCNVCHCSELAALCKLVSSRAFGINWDPVNEMNRKGQPFPEGYALLPKDRLHNVQMKARALVIGPDFLDWAAIFRALESDGYAGKVGLETHVFDGTLIEKSHLCMARLKELLA